MADMIRARAFTFDVTLQSQANANLHQTFPTLAAGDVQVQKDQGPWVNITTLPTAVAASTSFPVTLSSTETDCARLNLRFKDVAGAEWKDMTIAFEPIDFTITNYTFPMKLLNGDPATGKTITRVRRLNGGAFAVGTLGAVTEVSLGEYQITIPHADLNGVGMIVFTEATCMQQELGFNN